MSLPDECCPECHGKPRVVFFTRLRVDKKCTDCGHTWAEEQAPPLFEGCGGWVRLRGGIV